MDNTLYDYERRNRIYNLCILQFGSQGRDNEPNITRINSDGSMKPEPTAETERKTETKKQAKRKK